MSNVSVAETVSSESKPGASALPLVLESCVKPQKLSVIDAPPNEKSDNDLPSEIPNAVPKEAEKMLTDPTEAAAALTPAADVVASKEAPKTDSSEPTVKPTKTSSTSNSTKKKRSKLPLEERIAEAEKYKIRFIFQACLEQLKRLEEAELPEGQEIAYLSRIDKLRAKLVEIEQALAPYVVYEDAEYGERVLTHEKIVIMDTDLDPLNVMLTEHVNNLVSKADRCAGYKCVTMENVDEMLNAIRDKGDCPVFESIVPKDKELYENYTLCIVEKVNMYCRRKLFKQFVNEDYVNTDVIPDEGINLGDQNASENATVKENVPQRIEEERRNGFLNERLLEMKSEGLLEVLSEEDATNIIDLVANVDDDDDDDDEDDDGAGAGANEDNNNEETEMCEDKELERGVKRSANNDEIDAENKKAKLNEFNNECCSISSQDLEIIDIDSVDDSSVSSAIIEDIELEEIDSIDDSNTSFQQSEFPDKHDVLEVIDIASDTDESGELNNVNEPNNILEEDDDDDIEIIFETSK